MEAIENKWLKIVSEVEKEKKDCFFKRKSLKEEGFEVESFNRVRGDRYNR